MKSTCNICGKVLTADSLPALFKKVGKCCATPKPKKSVVKAPRPSGNPLRPETPLVLEFPLGVASQNASQYAPWHVYYATKKKWFDLVRRLYAPYHGLRLQYSEWLLERVMGRSSRLMDHSNLVGGAKPLIDALVVYGIIEDDSPVHFSCTYTQCKEARALTRLKLLEYSDDPKTF